MSLKSVPLRVVALTAAVATAASLATAPALADPAPSAAPRLSHASSHRQARVQAALTTGHRPVVLVAEVAAGTSVRGVAAQADAGPGSVRHVLTPLRRVSVRVSQADAASAAARLRALPGVESVTRAAYRYVSDAPNDPDYAGHQATYLGAVGAPAAWARSHASSDVKIAIVDTGLDVTHPDLDGKVGATYNAHVGGTDVTDDVGHGTFVAGVAAAETGNAVGVAGAGYDASILAVKVDYADPTAEDGYAITTDDEAAGIKWAADHGADIINLSLGAADPDDTEQAAITYAQDAGALIVAAAGNDGTDRPNYPAAYPGVVAVGATDAAGHRASFSNHGSWVTLAAPGTDIYSTVPSAGSTFWPAGSGYASAEGTSFSSPLVAGAAALVLGRNGSATSAQLRAALVASAHGYAGLGLGAGQVDLDAALDNVAPATTPGAPAVTGVKDVLAFRSESSAPSVRFAVDGTTVATVATTGGAATASFPSYGWANGAHAVTAVDCSPHAQCSASTASTSFDLANDAPIVTSPVDGERITGGFTIGATSSGGGVAFYVDDAKIGFDGTSPYQASYSGSALTEGQHTVAAVQCSASGAGCAGPTSAAVTITSDSLHPTISSVSPSPFSPNADKVRDTTTVTYALPDTEQVAVSVRSAAGNVVRGPVALRTQKKGTHTWVWNGRGNHDARLSSGTYTVVVSTSAVINGTTVEGEVSRKVVLDVIAPTVGRITGNRATFYPARDGYKDTFGPTGTLSEKATLYLQIRNARKHVVKTIKAVRKPGRTGLTWNATTDARRRVAAGIYSWQFIAIDPAGNRRASSSYKVTVSAKKLVSKSVVLTKKGDAGKYYGPECTDIYKSSYAHGIDVANFCDPSDFLIISGFFRFTLPAAVSYGSLTASTKGSSYYHPSEIAGVFTRFDRDDVDVSKILTVRSAATRTYALGSVSARGHYTSKRVAEFALALGNTYTTASTPSEFDVATVSLKVTYKVLR